jgi:hypothetical protein
MSSEENKSGALHSKNPVLIAQALVEHAATNEAPKKNPPAHFLADRRRHLCAPHQSTRPRQRMKWLKHPDGLSIGGNRDHIPRLWYKRHAGPVRGCIFRIFQRYPLIADYVANI